MQAFPSDLFVVMTSTFVVVTSTFMLRKEESDGGRGEEKRRRREQTNHFDLSFSRSSSATITQAAVKYDGYLCVRQFG